MLFICKIRKQTFLLLFWQNNRIQVSLRPRATNISLYGPMLKEGSVYVIKTFGVAENKLYPVTDHKFRLSFTKMTSLQVISDDDLHTNIFNFKTFAEIEQSDENTAPFGKYTNIFKFYILSTLLFHVLLFVFADLIAQICERGELRKISLDRSNEGKEADLLEIMIRNEEYVLSINIKLLLNIYIC